MIMSISLSLNFQKIGILYVNNVNIMINKKYFLSILRCSDWLPTSIIESTIINFKHFYLIHCREDINIGDMFIVIQHVLL